NRQQAAIPEKSKVLFNTIGTAPGLWIEKDKKVFIALPGVPYEMKEIMKSSGLPELKRYFNPPIILHKVIRTIGLGESFLAEAIKDWEAALPEHIKLAYLPSLGMVKLRLTAKGENENQLVNELNYQSKEVHKLIGKHIYGEGNLEIEQAIGNLLLEKKLTLSTAESCTGGNIGSLLTSVPGSSAYFKGSIIAYHNDVKIEQLKVQTSTLQDFGAVSEQTVLEMARNVREIIGTDIGIAVSGVAGPGGGTEEKPVGTVWIAYSDHSKTIAKKLLLTKDRGLNIKLTTVIALNFIRENLQLEN
ncbi:MAG: nicotinamide-nucleotide amidohydrolase family protein, partial [Opitutaceae bacterium]|nr:nicotinamide-nucleotide amidohydrolase family protein [Cytophagales bacterium]